MTDKRQPMTKGERLVWAAVFARYQDRTPVPQSFVEDGGSVTEWQQLQADAAVAEASRAVDRLQNPKASFVTGAARARLLEMTSDQRTGLHPDDVECDVSRDRTWQGQAHCGIHGVWFRYDDELPASCPTAEAILEAVGGKP